MLGNIMLLDLSSFSFSGGSRGHQIGRNLLTCTDRSETRNASSRVEWLSKELPCPLVWGSSQLVI